MKRVFPTLIVASAATGVALQDGMNFSTMAEVSSFVLGFPIWTHELGDRTTMDKVRAAILDQFPDMPVRGEGDWYWRAAAEQALAIYGDTIEVAEGTSTRAETPFASLGRMLARPKA